MLNSGDTVDLQTERYSVNLRKTVNNLLIFLDCSADDISSAAESVIHDLQQNMNKSEGQ